MSNVKKVYPNSKIEKYKFWVKRLDEDRATRFLKKSLGTRNISKLGKMALFLELQSGQETGEKFHKNIILLSFLSQFGKRKLEFAELVFQALYLVLSNNK